MFTTRSITLVYLALCLVLLAGCASSQQTVEPFEDDTTYIIRDTTQLAHETLSIGVGNFRKEACTDNPKKKCLSAAVWVFDEEQPDLQKPCRVQTGQTIIVGQYTILIVKIDKDLNSGWIELSIKSSGTPSPDTLPYNES